MASDNNADERWVEMLFKRLNTDLCDLFEMVLKDTHPTAFEKLKKKFLQKMHELKMELYRKLDLDWEAGRRYRMSRKEAERAGYKMDDDKR